MITTQNIQLSSNDIHNKISIYDLKEIILSNGSSNIFLKRNLYQILLLKVLYEFIQELPDNLDFVTSRYVLCSKVSQKSEDIYNGAKRLNEKAIILVDYYEELKSEFFESLRRYEQ